MPTSQLDAAVREHVTKAREHTFEPLSIDGVTGEYCKLCGREKKSLLVPGSSYQFVPCRGLVG